ncbi:MAG: diguanylate cyclase [Planctomycetes bacterium]|nr:diguanylate cyclase [Planctomycetota bacterium]
MQPPKPGRVLIIDDDPDAIYLLERVLAKEDHEIRHASTLEDALRAVDSGQVDLILLDLHLSGFSGFELLEIIRADEDLSDEKPYIPVVIVTSSTETEYKVRGLDLGADDYIVKPFDRLELRARVRSMLRLRYALHELSLAAMTDPLTGLYNRRFSMSRLQEEIDREKRYSHGLTAAMCDIDYFKKVNDDHGHLAGDFVLQRFANVLREISRTTDVVGRYGGEEFLLVLPETDLTHARMYCERLRTKLQDEVIEFEGSEIRVTVSIGAAQFSPEKHAGIQQFIEQADQNLYAAKRGGRNKVVA